MEIFNNLISVILLMFTAYGCYSLVRNRPDLFSAANISRSLTTMGILGLCLIGLVALLFYSLPEEPQAVYGSSETRTQSHRPIYDRSI